MGKRVLLADRSATIRKLVEIALEATDYELLAVSDGQEAVDQLDHFKPDIVLADTAMPILDGFEVCRRVKAHPDLADTPVVFVTSRFQVFDEEKAAEVGGNDRLIKPFSQDVLLGKIEALLPEDAEPEPEDDDLSGENSEHDVWGSVDDNSTVAISPEALKAQLEAEVDEVSEDDLPDVDDFDMDDDEDDKENIPASGTMELNTEDLEELDELDDIEDVESLDDSDEIESLEDHEIEELDDDEIEEVESFDDDDMVAMPSSFDTSDDDAFDMAAAAQEDPFAMPSDSDDDFDSDFGSDEDTADLDDAVPDSDTIPVDPVETVSNSSDTFDAEPDPNAMSFADVDLSEDEEEMPAADSVSFADDDAVSFEDDEVDIHEDETVRLDGPVFPPSETIEEPNAFEEEAEDDAFAATDMSFDNDEDPAVEEVEPSLIDDSAVEEVGLDGDILDEELEIEEGELDLEDSDFDTGEVEPHEETAIEDASTEPIEPESADTEPLDSEEEWAAAQLTDEDDVVSAVSHDPVLEAADGDPLDISSDDVPAVDEAPLAEVTEMEPSEVESGEDALADVTGFAPEPVEAFSADEDEQASEDVADDQEDIPAPAAAAGAVGAVGAAVGAISADAASLSEEHLDRIADKVAERLLAKLGSDQLRDIAWQVIPELAEAMIKKRIYELEQGADSD